MSKVIFSDEVVQQLLFTDSHLDITKLICETCAEQWHHKLYITQQNADCPLPGKVKNILFVGIISKCASLWL